MTHRSDVSGNGDLLIGEAAKRAGVNAQTLRYYERRGLIPEPERTSSGYRLYSADMVRMVRFIKRAQDLGFSLTEIDRLLALREQGSSSCDEVQALAERKIGTIDEKVRALEALRSALERLVRSCRRGDPELDCPILEALEEAATHKHRV